MTLEQLMVMFPETTNVSWIPHRHGGGWVQNTAIVAPTAFVGVDALVYDSAKVLDEAEILDTSRVFGNAQVIESETVSGDSYIYGDAMVFGNAHVSGDSRIGGQSRIVDDYPDDYADGEIHDVPKYLSNAPTQHVGYTSIADDTQSKLDKMVADAARIKEIEDSYNK